MGLFSAPGPPWGPGSSPYRDPVPQGPLPNEDLKSEGVKTRPTKQAYRLPILSPRSPTGAMFRAGSAFDTPEAPIQAKMPRKAKSKKYVYVFLYNGLVRVMRAWWIWEFVEQTPRTASERDEKRNPKR